jgi:transcriptional regulator with XRE-family HTH domain
MGDIEAAKKYWRANKHLTKQYVADLYGVDRSTLSRQLRGKTVPRAQYKQEIARKLTDIQEKKLCDHKDRLTVRGIPPTFAHVRRLAEEMSKKEIGEKLACLDDFASSSIINHNL